MYTSNKDITDKSRMTEKVPFGPGFTQEQANAAATMDIMHSSFKDDGDDYTMFVLKDSEGKVINKAVIGGY